jgi:hypothetical protein
VRKLALCASLAVLALAPGASGQRQATPAGVLLSKGFLGLYQLGANGPVQRLVGADIRPVAVAADGTAAGVRATDRDQRGPLFLARGARRTAVPNSSEGVRCVAFSADGSLVAYVSGTPVLTQPAPRLAYFRIEGTLWLAEVAHPEQARAVDAGAFAVSECPLPSPTGQRFAYMIQTRPGVWELRIYRDGAVRTVADEQTPVPSNHDRSFAWAPNGTLAFIRGDDLFVGHRRSVHGLLRKLAPRPARSRYSHSLDFSSNGRLIAVSFGTRTGIFRLNGGLVRIVYGHLIDWSGSEGVLTIGHDKRFVITFYRFPLHGPPRVLAHHFKLPAVSDPAGAWFAYPLAQSGRFVFRRADGSLLRIVRLHSVGAPLAAVDRSGHLSVPAGSY